MKVLALGEAGPDRPRSVLELDDDVEHLRAQVPVGEPAPPERAPPTDVEPHARPDDVRLEAERRLDRAGEARRRAGAHRGAEVLVEDATELDPRLEEKRLAGREPRGVVSARSVHRQSGAAFGRPTVKGPIT